MRSLFVRILIWLVATVLLAVLGFMITERIVFTRSRESRERSPNANGGPNGHNNRLNRWVINEAQTAYEAGGKEGLKDFLDDVGRYLPMQRQLLYKIGN